MICFSEVCKKAKPLAAPIAILSLVSQDSGSVLVFPNSKQKHKHNELNSKQIHDQQILLC